MVFRSGLFLEYIALLVFFSSRDTIPNPNLTKNTYFLPPYDQKQKDTTSPVSIKDVLRPGTEMVAAGYCMYGSSSVLVLTTGNGVNGYTLDPDIGEFLLTHPMMKLGTKKIYSINEGNAHTFNAAVKGYVDSLKYPAEGHSGKFTPYTARYVGSMVADVS